MADSKKTDDAKKTDDKATASKAAEPKQAKRIHYLMSRSGSTIVKDGDKDRVVSYGAGSIVEADEGALDHVGGAKAFPSAEKAKEALAGK